jgi:hypothetical protein
VSDPSDRKGLEALRPESRALLIRARRGGGDDPGVLAILREDLDGLAEEELAALWSALGETQSEEAEDGPAEIAYRAVDKARRRLLIPADRFKALLLEQVGKAGGAPAPDAVSGSLKALVAAFAGAGRAEEIEAAAMAIVRSRSLAHDIT